MMGSSEVLENETVRNENYIKSYGRDDLEGLTNDGFERKVNGAKENESLGDETLKNFDTYWKDVNDSLIRGEIFRNLYIFSGSNMRRISDALLKH
ncbi:hypothetical protein CQW23_12449 [Capsicum baccatum]|uniref:Uncharacterized protein n=1 Tax=Capsicum baccatum TaxID=33114 RepID=A0A2G2WSS7_CAPBA|nr:hypothetical protein CQW23_12449 [Capsicum baccatum]